MKLMQPVGGICDSFANPRLAKSYETFDTKDKIRDMMILDVQNGELTLDKMLTDRNLPEQYQAKVMKLWLKTNAKKFGMVYQEGIYR